MRRLVLAALLMATGCSTQLKLDDRPCPCSTGWVCCESMKVCVRDGASCPPTTTPDLSPPAPVPVSIAITPTSVTLPLGGAQRFSSSVAAQWTIDEGSVAGDIDADGNFFAAATSGTYHVTATAIDDTTQSAKATISVGPTTLGQVYGELGGMGDADGIGANARFNHVGALVSDGKGASDGKGTLFAFDRGNHSLRAIDIASGAVTTVMRGVPDLDVMVFVAPQSLFSIADFGQTITRIDLQAQTVATFAGDASAPAETLDGTGTAAHFKATGGITLADGALTVTDDATIRTVDLTTAAVKTLTTLKLPSAVKDPKRTNEGQSIAYAGSGQYLFADNVPLPNTVWADPWIRRFDQTTGTVTDVALQERCFSRNALGHGCVNVLCGDGENLTKHLAGTTYFAVELQSSPPGDGLSLQPSFNDVPGLLCGETRGPNERLSIDYLGYGGAIYRRAHAALGPTTMLVGTDATKGGVPGPLVTDERGNIYLGTQRVAPSGEVTTVGNLAPGSINGIRMEAADFAGHVFMSDGEFVWALPTAGGPWVPVASSGYSWMSAIAADSAGHLYLAGYGPMQGDWSNSVSVFDVSDVSKPKFLSPLVPTFGVPVALAVDRTSQSLYVAEAKQIKRVDLSDMAQPVRVIATGFGHISALSLEANGRVLYVADDLAHTVSVIDLRDDKVLPLLGQPGRQGVLLGALPASLNTPMGIAVTTTGDLLVGDAYEDVVLSTRR